MQKRVILFDLDGTLTDPKEGITKSVAYALKQINIEVETLDELCTFIGPPLLQSFMEYYQLTQEQASRAVDDYRVYFKKQGMLENKVYEGIADVLHILKAQGNILLVATSKPWVFAKTILEHFKLDMYFTGIYGSELDGTRTQKGDVIAYALACEGINAKDCVMIGDRKHDMIGAKLNGMKSIGVRYGYGDYQELETAGADIILSSIQELKEVLTNN